MPPRTAHRICPDIKLPGNTLTPCRTHTPPKKHQHCAHDVECNSHILSLNRTRTPPLKDIKDGALFSTITGVRRFRRIGFGHEIDIRLRNSFFAERLEEQGQPVRINGFPTWPRRTRGCKNSGPRANRLGEIRYATLAFGSERAAIDKFDVCAVARGLLHLWNRHSISGAIACVTTMCCTPRRRLPE